MDNFDWRRAVRPVIVILALGVLGLVNPMAAARASGTALVLVVVWIVVKTRWPTATSGWFGAWLFTTGLIAALWSGITDAATGNPVAAGIVGATILILPPMVVWKAGKLITGYSPRSSRGRDAGTEEHIE